jgi:hypothetical protein
MGVSRMTLELGLMAKDKITGFRGIMTGFVSYLTGCDQYLLAPPVDKEGKHVDAKWFDVNRIEVVVGAERVSLDTEEDKGACEPAPTY